MLALGSEAPTLVIVEAETLPTELFLEDAVLLDEVVDRLGLLAVDPACEGGEEELKREEFGHCTLIIDSQRDRCKSGDCNADRMLTRVRLRFRTPRAQTRRWDKVDQLL